MGYDSGEEYPDADDQCAAGTDVWTLCVLSGPYVCGNGDSDHADFDFIYYI